MDLTENIDKHSDPDVSEKVRQVLDELEAESKSGKFYMDIGVDTNFIQQIKNLITNPSSFFESFSEMGTRAFVAFFWEFLKRENVSNMIDLMGAEICGSRASVWIYLKTDSYTFENRAKIYSLRANLMNSIELFKKTDVDLMVLKKGDVELPPAFNRINLS